MAKTALTVTVHIDGARETLAAFNRLPKEASKSLRERTLDLSDALARKAAANAASDSAQSALLARTVKARKDRVPSIQAGGATRVGRNRTPAYQILFGSEFGMNRRSGWYAKDRYSESSGRQFRPHRGREGYWFFPIVEQEAPAIAEAWRKVADDIARDFSTGDIT